ncbi:MAG: terminase [Bacillus thermozeamaize]|uniref:Terminase n=1 Tax=Bacillus thermozeamaize TaxID=230954 RepID=A0A1Y3PHV0_9BACI|nr:MAG: terminase [Bacillus thermozeamaize]
MTNYILEYWNKIQSGEVQACRRLKQQYQKLVDELENPRDPWVFDLEKANRPIEFIERFCKHSKGKWIGKPVRLELFQKAKIQAVFGFVHKETGLRRAREVLTIIGRKNGKSTEKAALGLYMLVGDGEGGAEVYSIATKRDQARIVFADHAVPMVMQSPALSKHIRKRKTDLYFPVTFSKFEPLASDSNSLDGLNVHYAIMDELHAIKDRNLYDVIKQAMTAREQPLLDMITTAGFVRECIYDSIYEYACNVLDGIVEDERFLAFIYELDDRSEWTDYRMWEKANPGLGTIKDYNELAANVERAKNDPDFLPTVLTKDFNLRDTVAGTWLTFDQINNEETFTMDDIRDTYAVGGADLSSTTDLTCTTLLIMKPDGKKYAVQQYFLPEDLLKIRVKEDKIPYDKWHARGLLTLCPGNKVDYSMVTAWFRRMVDEYEIYPLWIGYDPWNSQYWVDEMKAAGFQMEMVRQGAQTLSQPMKEMGADLSAKRINYNNNPILKWCLTNTSVKRDENDNIRPVKGQNQRQRIDGAVSLLIAYTVLFNHMDDYRALAC